jgi:pimeloyl-ACP methyl ester carboxylesterase
MRFGARIPVCALVLSLGLLLPSAARAQVAIPGPCTEGLLPFGAESLICVPLAGWNGQLVVFAHGFVRPDDPELSFELPVLDGVELPVVVQSLGFAFATTSYRDNGLVILEGVDDLRNLLAAFSLKIRPPTRTHLFGVSEGGLVATLLAERSPELVKSAVAACAPIGNFRLQVNYIGDFRVLFDYFFPGIIPGTAIQIPEDVIDDWDDAYVPAIAAALQASPGRAVELMRVARAAHDPSNFATVINTAISALRYNVLGTNDATDKLGGNPYGNRLKLYLGSSNDLRLNLLVRRFSASPAALEQMQFYETNGDLRVPLVTLHTLLDELVPFGHELLYLPKVDLAARGRFVPLPVNRYGHCNFTTNELLGSFALAVGFP